METGSSLAVIQTNARAVDFHHLQQQKCEFSGGEEAFNMDVMNGTKVNQIN